MCFCCSSSADYASAEYIALRKVGKIGCTQLTGYWANWLVHSSTLFSFSHQQTATASQSAVDAIDEYRQNGNSGAAVDFMQTTFSCCGWNNASDWLVTPYYNSTQMFPGSCNCTDTQDGSGEGPCETINFVSIYRQGCRNSVQTFFQNNLIAVGAIGIAIGLFEVSKPSYYIVTGAAAIDTLRF